MIALQHSAWFILFYFSIALSSCNFGISEKEARAKKAEKATGAILIGVVHSSPAQNGFLNGVQLAIEEINQKGGLLGREIKSIVYDDMNDPGEAEYVAEKLAKNQNIVAVIGHSSSINVIPASVIYEDAGILFISYAAKDQNLTLYRDGHCRLRNMPTHKEFGAAMARFSVYEKKNKKIVVFHERNESQKSLANYFKKEIEVLKEEAEKEGRILDVEIVATRSYFDSMNDFRELIDTTKKNYEFDAVVICGETISAAAEFVKQLRDMNISVPIIGGYGLDSPDLFRLAKEASEGIAVPTTFNPYSLNKPTLNFVRKFYEKYKFIPDVYAAQGYDAAYLFGHAVEEGNSIVPATVSSRLRFLKKWEGAVGAYHFTANGDIAGKDIFFKEMRNGKFIFLNSSVK